MPASLTPAQLAAVEANRDAWNQRTPWHLRSDFYDVDAFRRGVDSLPALDVEAMGDVAGLRLVHLQCHFGQDTLSWARRGAVVTGLDLSDASVTAARQLAAELGMPARFERGNVYDAVEVLGERYDRVYTSYGALGWLPDMAGWAQVVAGLLVPGGELVLAEFHPFLWIYDDSLAEVVYPWDSRGEAVATDGNGTYAEPSAPIHYRDYGWNHGVGTVVQALVDAGLRIERLSEHDASPYDVFPDMVEDRPGEFVHRRWGRKVPYVYVIRARLG